MKSICVFCGSNMGTREAYLAAARALAEEIAGRGLTLVYGGANVGLMGALADAALAAGGKVIGVMPKALVALEIEHEGLSAFHKVGSMHERKALMADLSDGFIALPGGVGTLEEIFEIWTWGQLGYHAKPIGFLNIAGYYDKLFAFLDHQSEERFMRRIHRDMLLVEDAPNRLLDGFAAYSAPVVEKWISPAER
jgi:uncharacterized protein (TIGR00730 family)